jgi:predicted PurR-regulated permease PerM
MPDQEHKPVTVPGAAEPAEPRPAIPALAANTPSSDQTSRVMGRRALVALLLVFGAAMVPILRLFVVPIVVAIAFTTLFYPLYRWTLRRTANRRNLSSVLCCIVLLAGLLVPAYVVVHLVAIQSIDLYTTAEPKIRDLVQKGNEGPLGRLSDLPLVQWLRLQQIDWNSVLQEGATAAGRAGTYIVNKTSTGILWAVGNLFVVLFTMFYLFRDGEKLLQRLRYLSPLRPEYEEMLFSRFLLISRAAIKGTLLIGLIQGTLGALTFLVFGVKTWLLWGFVMVIFSILPFTGAWMVMVPASIIQFVLGNVGQGVGILVICLLVVSTIDNILRPRLVGGEARMHDLLIFFSTLGGIAVFGVMGFIVGPIIAAMFVTVLDIYGMEFRSSLRT